MEPTIPNRPPPKIVASISRKGGAGKSSLVALLAAHYATAGRSVLMVDLDVQGSLSMTLGHAVDSPTAGRVLAGSLAIDSAAARVAELVELLTGGPGVEEDLADVTPAGARAVLMSAGVDLVLLDTPPGHPAIDELASAIADVVVAPCEPNRMGVSGATRAVRAAEAVGSSARVAYVLSRLDTRRTLDRSMQEALAGAVSPTPVFAIVQDAGLAADLSGGRLPSPGRARDGVASVAAWIDR